LQDKLIEFQLLAISIPQTQLSLYISIMLQNAIQKLKPWVDYFSTNKLQEILIRHCCQ